MYLFYIILSVNDIYIGFLFWLNAKLLRIVFAGAMNQNRVFLKRCCLQNSRTKIAIGISNLVFYEGSNGT